MTAISGLADVTDTVQKPMKLAGNMGALGLAMTVLAFSAPLTTVAGYIPVSLMFGGLATPLLFLFAGIMMLLFAMSYLTLSRSSGRPGGFYAFITFGLGKSTGLGSGMVAAISYLVLLAGITSFFGVACAEFQKSLMDTTLPWYVFTLMAWAIMGILGYLNVEFSTKVLLWVMVSEVVICLGFAFGVLGAGGNGELSAAVPFSLGELMKENVVMTFSLLFIVSHFVGLESTALYREECKDPERNIPRATYGAVIFICVLYAICVYALIMAYGPSAQTIAADNPATMFPQAFGVFISNRIQVMVTILVLTSAFASALSTHNVMSRYLFNLGTDGAIPRRLGAVHPRHASPYIASMAVSAIVLLMLAPFIVSNSSPEFLYGQLSGIGTSGVIILMIIANLATLVWYKNKGKNEGANIFKSCVAPVISTAFFAVLIGLVIYRFDLLVGGEPGERRWMLYSLFVILLAGIALAQFYKRNRPEVFAKLGRVSG